MSALPLLADGPGPNRDWRACNGSDVRGLRRPYGLVDPTVDAGGNRVLATIAVRPGRIASDSLHIPARNGSTAMVLERNR